ncbi:MAG: hypothetical protein NDI69_14885 [Bacteriovoracaceae bacterium]|nr:hypothetical protein [Bacteriovoracaceae bacterium]
MNKLVVLASLALVGNTALAAKWNRSNNPDFFNAIAKKDMTKTFADLPLVARLQDDRYGWSESFWPSRKGGVAFRWNHPDPQPFTYRLHTKEEIMAMNETELGQLSPAELYDLSQGDYNYTLTKKTLSMYKPTDLWWEGICDGWATAANNYAEPNKVVITNKDGVKVPFGASDVKALIAMHDTYNSKGRYVRIGDRCNAKGKVAGEGFEGADTVLTPPPARQANKPACEDVNAGAFHIVLASMIGVNSQGFVAEIDRYADVWNQPIVGYESVIVGEVALTPQDVRNKIARKVQLKTVMTYTEELVVYNPKYEAEGHLGFISKEPVTGTPAQTFATRNYEYILELDINGNIMGGEWISESRPDMLWMKSRDAKFMNGKVPLAGLNEIYTPVKH